MKIRSFEWTRWNMAHIAKHIVNSQEVEEACYRRPLIKRSKDGLYLVYGRTYAGRYLFIVVRYKSKGIVYVITARDMAPSERKLFMKRR